MGTQMEREDYDRLSDASNRAAALATFFGRLSFHTEFEESFNLCELSGIEQIVRGVAADIGDVVGTAEIIEEKPDDEIEKIKREMQQEREREEAQLYPGETEEMKQARRKKEKEAEEANNLEFAFKIGQTLSAEKRAVLIKKLAEAA